jgi:hypothetical protein
LRRAVELRQQELGSDDPATLDSCNSLAVLLVQIGHFDKAVELHKETLKRYQVTLGPDIRRGVADLDGEGDTANARSRAIGGHPGVIVSPVCRMKAPGNPYADDEGYVPLGKLIDYGAGRSNGCTSWPPAVSEWILALVKDRPTTLYIYPESTDIVAVARAVKAGQSPARAGLYWNASCLKEIGFPNFWPSETLEPALMKFREDHPPSPPQPLPLCGEQYVRLGD